jgi:ankyrin repeat protein
MKWIKLFEEFQLGDLNFMSPEEIQDLFFEECQKETPDLELIKVILDNGLVDVNVKDRYDLLPLHWAVFWGNEEIQSLLKKHGAVE